MTELTPEMQRIIEVANELQTHGDTSGSTGEKIAAAFILNRAELLPDSYPVMYQAWDRLGEWQQHVRAIREEYMDRIC